MKLLASDFDRTLFFHPYGFKKADLRAIKEMQAKGYLFGVATGRSLKGVSRVSRLAPIHYDFYVCTSGSMIYDDQRHLIYERTIDAKIVQELCAQVDACATIVCGQKTLLYHGAMLGAARFVKNIITSQGLITRLEEISNATIHAFSFHFLPSQQEEAKAWTRMINARYGSFVSAYQNKYHVDVTAAHISKGTGLRFLEAYFQIAHEHVYAIGDTTNDIPMMIQAAHSYAINGAPLDVQAVCDRMVPSVGACIEELMKTPAD